MSTPSETHEIVALGTARRTGRGPTHNPGLFARLLLSEDDRPLGAVGHGRPGLSQLARVEITLGHHDAEAAVVAGEHRWRHHVAPPVPRAGFRVDLDVHVATATDSGSTAAESGTVASAWAGEPLARHSS